MKAHFINRLLFPFGLSVSRTQQGRVPKAFMSQYRHDLDALKSNANGWDVLPYFNYDAGEHPESYVNSECAFAAEMVSKARPANILDIGSYRWFILGMLSAYPVTTLDVRERKPSIPNETVITSDAKQLNLPDNSFDCVVSLCALEHFGLGRYGDEVDMEADKKAISEMARVLRPGGHLVLTTHITNAPSPAIAFNAHRIYHYEQIHSRCLPLTMREERFLNPRTNTFITRPAITRTPEEWDIYCGLWQKPEQQP